MRENLLWVLVFLMVLSWVAIIVYAVKSVRRDLTNPTRYRNPANGYVETVSLPLLWGILFGPFYYARKGLWIAAVVSVIFPPSWLIFPFMARGMIARLYLRQGWTEEGHAAS